MLDSTNTMHLPPWTETTATTTASRSLRARLCPLFWNYDDAQADIRCWTHFKTCVISRSCPQGNFTRLFRGPPFDYSHYKRNWIRGFTLDAILQGLIADVFCSLRGQGSQTLVLVCIYPQSWILYKENSLQANSIDNIHSFLMFCDQDSIGYYYLNIFFPFMNNLCKCTPELLCFSLHIVVLFH